MRADAEAKARLQEMQRVKDAEEQIKRLAEKLHKMGIDPTKLT